MSVKTCITALEAKDTEMLHELCEMVLAGTATLASPRDGSSATHVAIPPWAIHGKGRGMMALQAKPCSETLPPTKRFTHPPEW